ncbi:MAG TPA: alkaline phosphatase family protein [Verrucomicrobiae bacterium]|nr:alkaline phosphatase family protein [Verrucomicrobiae bacterium]
MKPHNPIEHVIIVVKENHSFDNYFGSFPGVNGANLPHAQDPPVAGDPPHDHAAWLETQSGQRPAVKGQYLESDIPAYFAYARQFTLCDNYFTEVASQSEPNHLMLIAADSPIIDNASAHRTYQPQAPFNIKSLPDVLAKAGLSWASYGDPGFNYFNHISSLKGSPYIHPWTQFDTDVSAGNLPNVSWMYAPGSPDRSEHPPYGANAGQPTVKLGMQWTADRVAQLAKSNLWSTCAFFITWDDWGGWYDHVQPPAKDTWPGGGPNNGPGYTGTQFSYGPRVGCLVLSPYSKRGISSKFHSHVSLVRFCEKTFGLAALNARDAASDDMSDCFDFTQTPLGAPAWSPTPAPGVGGHGPAPGHSKKKH